MKRFALALFLLPALAHAGMDGFYTLASATGKVEVRTFPNGKWRPLKLRGIVAPSAEVRTGNNATAVLEGGDVPDAKRHRYVDDYFKVVTIGPNSLFRTLDPGSKSKAAQGRIAGTVKIKQEHGLLQYNDGRSLKTPPGAR